jgi:tripartite-type tricarboxylate transporter receptor subunit TctC
MNRLIAALAGIFAVPGLGGSASAQTYPDRTIDLIVPSTPGSSSDIIGRMLNEEMAPILGQRFIIHNKPGAGGVLGTAEVSRAKPDGYTLFHGAAFSITVQPLTERQTGYSLKSFEPICQTFKNDQVIVARPDSYKTLADLIAASKAKPGGLNFGTPGLGTIPHLAMADFSQVTKVVFNHVPFKGPAESIQMTLGGQIDFAVAPLTAASGSGLQMVALFAERRNPSIPDVPTVKEQGFDVAPLSIGGMLAPAGLPAEIKTKLDNACKTAVQSDAFQRLAKRTLQPADFFQDSKGFAVNLEKDLESKRLLLTALGMVK